MLLNKQIRLNVVCYFIYVIYYSFKVGCINGKIKKIISKIIFGLIAITLILSISNDASAKTILHDDNGSESEKNISSDNVDWDVIISALSEEIITDGSRIVVDNKYMIYCEDIIESIIDVNSEVNLGIVNKYDVPIEVATHISQPYSATRHLYITYFGSNTHIATITHSITVWQYDNNGDGYIDQIHIYSGSLSGSSQHALFNVDTYGYQISNTNGSFSSAMGMVEIYDVIN